MKHDAFDELGVGMEQGVRDVSRLFHWFFSTCVGGITLIVVGSIVTMYVLDILKVPHLGG